jgi:hypothetical protein
MRLIADVAVVQNEHPLTACPSVPELDRILATSVGVRVQRR